jgi:phospholipid/cholesterol/gamma-HCH transport system substrate-binding protein
MSTTWERVRTVPGLGRDVAAVTVLIIGALVSLGIMYPKMTTAFPWENRAHVHVEFPRVPGVNPDSSQKVTIAGVIVGQVVGWEVTDHNTAVLDLNIQGEQRIYQNARAILRPKNVLNDMTVELNPGGPPAPVLGKDEVIPETQTDRPVQVDEILDNLPEKSQVAVDNLIVQANAGFNAMSPAGLGQGLRATQVTLDDIRPVVQSLDVRRDKIAKLTTSLARFAQALGRNDERAAKLVDSTQQALAVLGDNDTAVRRSLDQLPGLNDNLRSAMSAVQPLTDQLNPTIDDLGSASKEFPKALNRFEDTLDQLDDTVDSAKPFVKDARPVVDDLKHFVDDADQGLRDLKPVSKSLQQDTKTLTTYLENIRAFIYNTRSVFGAGDGPEKVIIRGFFVFRLPDGGGTVGGMGGYAPTYADSGKAPKKFNPLRAPKGQ